MKKTLHAVEVVTPEQAAARALADEVQLSLARVLLAEEAAGRDQSSPSVQPARVAAA